MTTLVFDIEADGLLETVAQVWCIVTYDIETGRTDCYGPDNIREGIRQLQSADVLVAHNGTGYDLPVIRKVCGASLDESRVQDTLVLSRLGRPVRHGGHSLAAWGERLGYPKVEHEEWDRYSPEMLNRCKVDVEITYKLWCRLKPMYDIMPKAIETDHKVAILAQRMVERGFTLDVTEARKVLDEKLTYREHMLDKFQHMFPPVLMPTQSVPKVYKSARNALKVDPGVPFTPLKVEEFVPTARQQVARRLIQKYGWKPKVLTPTGVPKVDETILRELPYPEAKEFADFLVNDKLLSQLDSDNGWLKFVDADNRVHASFNPTGANTHRSSCSRPNLQQVSKAPEMRQVWIPSDGMVLVGVDAAGLELRCFGHYLHKYDGGAYIDILLNGDIHEHVRQIIGFTTRDKTKNAEYGWLYGAGNAKLGAIAREDARYGTVEINPRISNTKLGTAMRRNLEQGIEGLDSLVRDVYAKAATGKIRGIDQRPLWVRSQHSALNLLLQSCGAIIIKTAWSLFDLPRGAHTVMQVHDEWQIECPPEMAETVGQHVIDCIKQAGEVLNFKCPLDGSYHIGRNWNETH